MSLPRKLKQMMLFNDGTAYVGEVTSVTLPKLTRKLEEYRGAGMDTPLKVDMGGEPLELEFSCGGFMADVVRQFGITEAGGVLLRFAGAYQREDNGDTNSIDVVVRGRHEEIDMGEAKLGEDTEFKVKSALTYYKLSVNGFAQVEIDTIGMVFRVGGSDRLSSLRDAIGL